MTTNPPLFDDDEVAVGKIATATSYGVMIPPEFPSKFEEQHLVKSMIDNAIKAGEDPLTIYVALKQLERMAALGQDQIKEDAKNYVNLNMLKFWRGVKVSMRAAAGYFKFDDDVEQTRKEILDEIAALKSKLAVVESEAKLKGKGKKFPGAKGINITFKEV